MTSTNDPSAAWARLAERLAGLGRDLAQSPFPVGPRETVQEARSLVDRLIVLRVPELFYAVGNFYRDFEQVEDREVLQYRRYPEQSSEDSTRRALVDVQKPFVFARVDAMRRISE